MSIRFILGRAGSGKTTWCINAVRERCAGWDPLAKGGDTVLLTPEQSTFIYEQMLLNTLPGIGAAHITGFTRLAWLAGKYLLARGKGERKAALSDSGKAMLVTKILLKNAGLLKTFPGRAEDMALAAADLIKELKTAGISPAMLRAASGRADEPLKRKMSEAAFLLERYQEELLGTPFSDADDDLPLLRDAVEEHGFLAGAYVTVDGFASFSPQELAVMAALLKSAHTVEIALMADPAFGDRTLPEDHFLYQPQETLLLFKKMAEKAGIEILPSVLMDSAARDGKAGRFAPALDYLEKNLLPPVRRPSYGGGDGINLLIAPDRRAEAEGVGRKIVSLVRDHGYRYRDIAVCCRSGDDYFDLLSEVFGRLKIPFFADRKKPLVFHPLTELIRAALTAAAEGLHYRAVFGFLKNALSPLSPDETAELENYCLMSGIRPRHWAMAEDWRYFRAQGGRSVSEEYLYINELRRKGIGALTRFREALIADSMNIGEVIAAVNGLLDELGIEDAVRRLAQREIERGRPESAAIHLSALARLRELLYTAEQTLKDTALDLGTVIAVFEAGFSSLRVSLPPQGMDQVFLAEADRSRTPGIKISFLIGLNEGVFPKRQQTAGFFSAAELEGLKKAGCPAAPSAASLSMQEYYLAYAALTRASERLYISYAAADSEGGPLFPSAIYLRVKDLFGDIKEEFLPDEGPGALVPGADALSRLALYLSQNRQLGGYMAQVYNFYAACPEFAHTLEIIHSGFYYRGGGAVLGAASRRKVFKGNIYSSVSRLERYRQCPLSYFAAYLLKLRKRPEYLILSPDRGTLLHEAVTEAAVSVNNDWEGADEAFCEKLAEKTIQKLAEGFLGGILNSSARYRAVSCRLSSALTVALNNMAVQMRSGSFRQAAHEADFSFRSDLPALRLPFGGGNLLLSGRIDRIDIAEKDGASYIRVIDYKSGKPQLTVTDVYNGDKLQLMVYLLVALNHARILGAAGAPRLAGAFYVSLRDEMEDTDYPPEDMSPARPGLKMSGLAVGERDMALLHDREISGWSEIVPLRLKKDGTVGETPSAVTEEELRLLLYHTERILADTAAEMARGMINPSPNPLCEYCDYRVFCGLDYDFALKDADTRKPGTDKEAALLDLRRAYGDRAAAERIF